MTDVYEMLADALRERDELKRENKDLVQGNDELQAQLYRQVSEASQRAAPPPEASIDVKHEPISPEVAQRMVSSGRIQSRSVATDFPILSEPPCRQPAGENEPGRATDNVPGTGG